MAPAAAAVTPLTKALTCGFSPKRSNQRYGIDDEEIGRQEDADRGHGAAREPGDEIADEGHRDHHRPRA